MEDRDPRKSPLEQPKLRIEQRPIASLALRRNNPRTHSDKQIRQIAASIETFGFTNPVLIDSTSTVIAGHGRVRAAKQLGMDTVPTVQLEHLTDEQVRAYVIADNKLAECAGWDRDLLAIELQELAEIDLSFDREGRASTTGTGALGSEVSAAFTMAKLRSVAD